jgi:small subunit ribosomal protein S5
MSFIKDKKFASPSGKDAKAGKRPQRSKKTTKPEDTGKFPVEHVVSINKNARTVKGGRVMSFGAIVVIGDKEGSIGYAREKALTVSEAVNKALRKARAQVTKIELGKGTLLYPLTIEAGATKIFLQQAAPGTGIVANHCLRCIFEALGVKNVLSKVYGSRNSFNQVEAAIKALRSMRSVKYFANKRGLTYQQMFFAAEEPAQQLKEESR